MADFLILTKYPIVGSVQSVVETQNFFDDNELLMDTFTSKTCVNNAQQGLVCRQSHFELKYPKVRLIYRVVETLKNKPLWCRQVAEIATEYQKRKKLAQQLQRGAI